MSHPRKGSRWSLGASFSWSYPYRNLGPQCGDAILLGHKIITILGDKGPQYLNRPILHQDLHEYWKGTLVASWLKYAPTPIYGRGGSMPYLYTLEANSLQTLYRPTLVVLAPIQKLSHLHASSQGYLISYKEENPKRVWIHMHHDDNHHED